MPISRQEKEEQVQSLTEQFQKSQVIVWTEYRGLTTPRLEQLRRALRPHDAEFRVVKNTLARLALERAGLPISEEMLAGPTAAGMIYGDIAAAARAMADFAATNREFAVKGGQANARLLAADQIAELVHLPSREVLLSRVLGGINAPVSGLVTVLSGTVRGLVNVLQAHARKLEEASA